MEQFAYLIGTLILGAVWAVIFLWRKDLRREMVFISVITLPFAFTEFLFVPEYWQPPSLFDLINRIGFGIEDLLFAFFAGGLAAVVFEFFKKEKLKKYLFDYELHLVPYFLVTFLFIGLEFIVPEKTIYNLTIALFLAAFLIAYRRPDLIRQIVYGGIFFGLLYFGLFVVFNNLFPEFVTNYYIHKNIWPIKILNVPLEEIVFAIGLGTSWSVLYEYMKGYKTKKI